MATEPARAIAPWIGTDTVADDTKPHGPSIAWRRVFRYLALCALLLYGSAWAVRLRARNYYLFAAAYITWALTPPAVAAAQPTHLFFLFVDHFEPAQDAAAVRRWLSRYASLAARHRDSDGRVPRHTWFYPGEQANVDILEALRATTAAGLGEVEMHFHHDHATAYSFRRAMEQAMARFQEYGFLKTIDGTTAFSFVHGNSGLDNSDGPQNCGVDTELRVLRELGCFADFTFPSVYEVAQPPSVNTIYAAAEDGRAKSYARMLPLSALRDRSADLMIFEGPLIFAPTLSPRRLFFELDDGNIHESVPASPARVARWVRANVHVSGRPDWVFVKVFAHGISTAGDVEASLGPGFEAALRELETRYNDGTTYRLHYVTAREAYNLALAANDGVRGEPSRYFDYRIGRYVSSDMADTAAPASR